MTTIMFACSYGAAFGAIQQIPQIVPGLADVQGEVAEQTGGKPAGAEKAKIEKDVENKAASNYTKVQEVGGLTGRFLLALLAVRILSRRALLRVFQLPGLLLMPVVFAVAATPQPGAVHDPLARRLGLVRDPFRAVGRDAPARGHLLGRAGDGRPVQFLGELPAAGLPGPPARHGRELCGQHRRPDDRDVVCLGHAKLAVLPFIPGGSPPAKIAYTAAAVALFVYAVGSLACCWLPEPKRETLAE